MASSLCAGTPCVGKKRCHLHNVDSQSPLEQPQGSFPPRGTTLSPLLCFPCIAEGCVSKETSPSAGAAPYPSSCSSTTLLPCTGQGYTGVRWELDAVGCSLVLFAVHSSLQAQTWLLKLVRTRCQGSMGGFEAVASIQLQTFHLGGQPRPSPQQTLLIPTPHPIFL